VTLTEGEIRQQIKIDQTWEELDRLVGTCCCAECEGLLVSRWNSKTSLPELVCGNNPAHEGYIKVRTLTQDYEEGRPIPLPILNVLERRKERKLEKDFGTKGTELAQYQGVTSLDRRAASIILKTIWPNAPDNEVLRAALLCVSYGLNPLMNHVFLIPFKERDANGNETGVTNYATVLGMKAKRLIASRQGRYGYIDNTPRVMTDEEQKMIRGKVEENRIVAITKLRDKDGFEAQGYGFWDIISKVKGADKGNSPEHMAMLRSESAALDRLFPGEMPANVEVIDESFIEGEYKEINGAEVDTLPSLYKPEQKGHWCSEHGISFDRHEKDGKIWYSHRTKVSKEHPKGYCNEAQALQQETQKPDPTKVFWPITRKLGYKDNQAVFSALKVKDLSELTITLEEALDFLAQLQGKDWRSL